MKNIATLLFIALLVGCSSKSNYQRGEFPIIANSDCNHAMSQSSCRDKNGNLVELNRVNPANYYEYIDKK